MILLGRDTRKDFPKMKKQLRFLLLGVLLIGIFGSGCQITREEASPDPVILQLKWVHQASFSGFYVAQEKGYYAAENLAVTFIEGGPGVDVIQQISSGEADFGVAAPEQILIHRGSGVPVVAIATIFQVSPVVFVTLSDSGIQRPADLYGHKVAIEGVDDYEIQFRAIYNKLGLDIQQIEIVPHSYDLMPLYEGQIDCIGLYATGGLLRLRQDGYQANLIWPSDYGVHMYSDTIVTNEELVLRNPDLVKRFLRASLLGWQDAVGNAEAAVVATLKYAKEADPDLQTEMMTASLPLVHTGEVKIGWMQPEIWQSMIDTLLEQGVLDQSISLDEVYDRSFLKIIYPDEQ